MYKQHYLLTQEELRNYLYYLNNEKGLSISKIARKLGCSIATVSRYFDKFGIPLIKNYDVYVNYRRYGFDTINDLYEHIKTMRESGYTKTRISQELGCTRQTAIRLLKRFHLK